MVAYVASGSSLERVWPGNPTRKAHLVAAAPPLINHLAHARRSSKEQKWSEVRIAAPLPGEWEQRRAEGRRRARGHATCPPSLVQPRTTTVLLRPSSDMAT